MSIDKNRNVDDCHCGHPITAHDAGECWTYPEAYDHPDPRCECGWYEPIDHKEPTDA